MPEYLSNKKRKQSIGINSYSEYTDTTKIIGNVLVGFGSVGVGTTVPTQDVDVNTIRVRDTLYDYTNSGGEFGYYLVKDTDGIKWVAVPPIDSNAIFVAENNNILGVSSFTGLNIIADELLGVTPNPINPNFADITILPRWLKSGETGIYTTKNVGIGTTIPTTDFQVGFGTTGVTIDGSIGVVSALGYYGNYAFIDQITVNDQLNVVGLGSTLVAAFLASAGGITTTGGDLYVGGSLFADKLDIINLKVVNIEATGITTLNVGIVSTFRVTGVSTLGVTSTADLFVDANLEVSGITTLGITSTKDLFVDENLYVVGIATATRFSTGATGSAINITSNTISGPAEIIIDPAGVDDNSGAVRIKGDLFVDGEEFIVNSTTIELADFNVGIASTVGTNLLLDGAGIGIGSTNIRKTLTYDYSSDSLKSSENFDLESGKVYKINETEVLSSTQLTVANINATGVSTIGTLEVTNFIDTKDLQVTGITTLGVTSTKDLLVDANLEVTGITTLGITSTTDLLVDGDLRVTGVSTFVGFSTFNNSVIIQDNLLVSGVSTFVGVGTFSGDLYVSDILYADVVTGLTSTTDLLVGGDLRVTGITTLGVTTTTNLTSQQLYVSGVSTFVGVGTFSGDLYVSDILYADVVTGLTSTTDLLVDGDLRVTGVSTFVGFSTFNDSVVIEDNLLVSGITTLAANGGITTTGGNLYVGGILYADTVSFDSIQVENINATGITTLNVGIVSSLIVTGITTLGVTSTKDLLVDGNLEVTGVSTFVGFSTFNNSVVIEDNLLVSGVSTFVGVGTFSGDLYVGGDLYVTDDLVFDEFTARNANVTGIGTIETLDTTTGTIDFLSGTNLSYSGISTLGVTTISELYVSGVSTFVGIGTFIGDLYVGGDLYVSDDIVFDEFTARNANVTGIGTIETLDTTTGTIDYLTGTNVSYSGIGTIETLDTTTGTIDYLTGTNLSYSGIGTIETLDVTTGTIDYLTGTNVSYSGIGTIETLDTTTGTIDYLTGTNLSYSGIATLGITTISQLYVSGVSTFVGVGTFSGDLYVGGILYADTVSFDNIQVENIEATGISTLNVGIVSSLTVTGLSTLGVTSTTDLLVGGNLEVTGVSTFVGVGTFSGDLYVGGDLYVTDDLVFDEFTARNANITGIGTIETLDTSTGTIDFLSGTNVSYSGIGTIETLDVTTGTIDYLSNTNLNTSGIGTIETLDTTTGSIDYLTGTNLSYSGIGTIETLDTTTGTIDFLSGTNLSYSGISTLGITSTTNLTSQQLLVTGIATLASIVGTSLSISGISTLGITSTTNLTSQQLNVSGISTLGVTTTTNLTTQQLNVSGITTLGVTSTTNLTSQQLNVSGITTLGVTSTTNLTSQQLNVTGITTLASIVGTSLSITGISTLGVTTTTNLTTQQLNVTGITTLTSIVGTSLSISGISTLGVTSTTNLTTQQLNVSGITTLGVTTISQLYVSGVSTFSDRITGIISTAAKLETPRIISLTGDLDGSVSFDGTGNVSFAATIQPNSVGLGTDTFGDYVKDIRGTENQITVTGGTGEGSTPIISFVSNPTIGGDVTIGNDLQVNRNLNVNGNITIGGTSAILFTQTFKVYDSDIILGIRTDGNGNDISTDNSANHGGIAIASTDGNPLVTLTNTGIGETLPATYKKFMWFKAGSFGIGTDAWLSNYAIGIGSTQFPTGTRLAAGSVQFTENDLAVVRDINASGIITATEFKGTLTGYASSAGIATNLNGGPGVVYQYNTGITSFVPNATEDDKVLIWKNNVPVWGTVDTGSLSGSIDYAVKAGVATYADNSGIATNLKGGLTGNIPYQLNPDITTFVDNSSATPSQVLLWDGSAPVWGDISAGSIVGVVTYADNAGIAVTVIGGIASVTSLNVSGISTLGITSTTNLTSQQLNVTGITTLTSIVGTSLSITGISTLGITSTTNLTTQQLNVTGITTLGVTSTTNLTSQQLNVSGITTLGITSTTNLTSQQLNVSGVTTLASIVGTSLSISGISTLGVTSTTNLTSQQLNVSGITTLGVTTTTNLTSQQLLVTGISTLGVTSTTNLTSQQLNVSGITTLGVTTIGQLYVSGVSTFVGVGTFIEDLYVGGDLYVADDIFFDEFTARNANITGISTLGITSTTNLTSQQLNVSGITTLGVTSTTNLTSQQLNVTGITTLTSIVGTSLSISGISTLGVTSTTNLTTQQLNVSGITTLGITSATNLTTQQLNVSGITTLGITSATNLTSQQLNVTGVTTLTSIVGTSLSITGISTLGVTSTTNLTSQQLNVSGITTLASIVGTSLSITGISTIANFRITNVGTGATVGGVGVLTYYGDGSQLTGLTAGVSISTNTTNQSQLIPYVTGTGSTTGFGVTTLFTYNPFSGNLGIGTTNPQGALHITNQNQTEEFGERHVDLIVENPGIGNARIFLKTATNNRDWEFFADDTDGSFGIHDGVANRRVFSISTDSYIGIGTAFNENIQPLQRLDVRGGAHISDNLGIGTTNPGATLNVVPTETSIAGLFSGTTSSDMVRITQLGTGNALVIEDSTNPDASPFVIKGGGYGWVGIGTTNPLTELHLQSVDPTLMFLESDASTNNQRWINSVYNEEFYWQAINDSGAGGGNLFKFTRSSEQIQTFEGLSGGVSWFTINNDTQRVGIGTTIPTSSLTVQGDVFVSGVLTSTDYNSASDINLKENIKLIENPIDKVLQINGVTFDWKENGRSSMGVIAQEVEKIIPELVNGTDSKTVNYNGLIGLLIEVVKEQQKEINTLKEKIK